LKLLQNAASKKAALTGWMLCIDPSSGSENTKGEKSEAGWAMFHEGKLLDSGTLKFPAEKVVFKRLRNIKEELYKIPNIEKTELFVIEDIRGYRAQQSLIQACGIFIDRTPSNEFFQVNVQTWKAVARVLGGYIKGDEEDAKYMGYATVAIAHGWKATIKEVEKKENIIQKTKETLGWPEYITEP